MWSYDSVGNTIHLQELELHTVMECLELADEIVNQPNVTQSKTVPSIFRTYLLQLKGSEKLPSSGKGT